MKGARVGTQLWDRWIFESEPASEPVLAATRSYGKGRIAALAINPAYIHQFGHTKFANNNCGEMSFGQIDGMILEKATGRCPATPACSPSAYTGGSATTPLPRDSRLQGGEPG